MCESCWEKRAVRWVVVNDNFEVEMCAKCRRELKSTGEKVELIKL